MRRRLFMKQCLFLILTIGVTAVGLVAQSPTPSPQRPASPVQTRESVPFELADYGVSFEADTRLIIMMAALDVAGFDPQPGREPSVFRQMVKRDLATRDPDLRSRLKHSSTGINFASTKLPPNKLRVTSYSACTLSTAGVVGARAFGRSPQALGVLDLLRCHEFYRRSGAVRAPRNLCAYQAEVIAFDNRSPKWCAVSDLSSHLTDYHHLRAR